jgi:uncharacterized protein (TIGR02246 family)
VPLLNKAEDSFGSSLITYSQKGGVMYLKSLVQMRGCAAGLIALQLIMAQACQPATQTAVSSDVLMEMDRRFSVATREQGAEGWTSFFAEDGIMLPEGSAALRGKEAIHKAMEPFFSVPGNSLEWDPEWAEISDSGDLGYTVGSSVLKSTDQDGNPTSKDGKYLTVWKRQADGSWKVTVDIGNSGNP